MKDWSQDKGIGKSSVESVRKARQGCGLVYPLALA